MIKVEYINPFLKALVEVTKVAAQVDVKPGTPKIVSSPFVANNIAIMVGIVGEFKGQAVISIPEETAKNIS